MLLNYKFTKLYHGTDDGRSAAQRLLGWLDARCADQGLLAVNREADSHFTCLLIASDSRWLHFDHLGHFLPADVHNYQPVSSLLSQAWPLVTLQVSGEHSYALRRYENGQPTARYANQMNDGEFSDPISADIWKPVYEDWQDLLAESVSAEEFYELLPAPRTPQTPTPIVQFDHYDLPEHLAHLFGWNQRLNLSSVGQRENGVVGRGDDFFAVAGDYSDEDYGLSIYVRCYAHPQPASNYRITAEPV